MLAKGLSARFISFTVMFSLWLMGCGTAIHQPVIDRPPGPLYRYPLYTYPSPPDPRGGRDGLIGEFCPTDEAPFPDLRQSSLPQSSLVSGRLVGVKRVPIKRARRPIDDRLMYGGSTAHQPKRKHHRERYKPS